ncbi:uncharacterized protein LOC113359805 [Papaver somniferum]|uniref:uncharacterized protein LOC113359805 n=1 Tax=Papaver somniferum TaxID=3469 RepID=UPI000E700F35|nr:uncharacterized protein LOC113359805 [Papaver somniferum]
MSEFRLAPDPSRDQLVIPRHLPSRSKVTRTPTMTELLLGKGNSSDQSPIPSSQELASSQDIPMSQERAFNGRLAVKRSCKAAEWEFIIKCVGQDFYGGRDEARLVVEKYNQFFGRKVRVVKSNPERYTVEYFCKEKFTCEWMFHAAPKTSNMKGHLFLKTYNGEHTCCAGYSDGTKVDPVTRELVKSLIFDQIEQNPNKKVRDIVREFKSDYGLELSYDQVHAEKELCLKELYGEDTKSYTDLVWWCEAVKKHDPGSGDDLVIEEGQFKSLFLAFDACISGFEYCRPEYFLWHTVSYQHLKNNVRGKTNRKKGEHGAAIDLFKQCLYSSMHEGFHQGMQKLKDMGCDGLHKFLSDLKVECWSNAHCLGCRYGDMCSNIAESFNSWIKEAKGMPIETLVNWIRLKIMDQMSKRKFKGATYKGFICPRIEKKVTASIRAGVHWRITKSGDMECEVFDGKHTHAINVYEYINPYFSIASFRASYDCPIKPIPDYDKPIDVATGNLVNPPTVLGKKPGRPKKKRIPNTGSASFKRPITCASCCTFKNLPYYDFFISLFFSAASCCTF